MDRRENIVDGNERDYPPQEGPVDGTYEPEPNKVPGPINVISNEIEAATEEELRRTIELEGTMRREPEIETYEEFGRARSPGMAAEAAGIELPYEVLYPTHFDWRADVARLVNRIQAQFPWQTYANTYYMHPPVHGRTYEFVSVDFWGGGVENGVYVGYRGKPIWSDDASLGGQVWSAIFNDEFLPNIHWIIWSGSMWTRGWGWTDSPPGPPDSDAGHFNHIHVTYLL